MRTGNYFHTFNNKTLYLKPGFRKESKVTRATFEPTEHSLLGGTVHS